MKKKRRIYSDEELENIAGLCDVLQQIRSRLIREEFGTREALDKYLAEKRKELKMD